MLHIYIIWPDISTEVFLTTRYTSFFFLILMQKMKNPLYEQYQFLSLAHNMEPNFAPSYHVHFVFYLIFSERCS